MSALTEKVAQEHQLVHIVLAVIICACGEKPATYRDYTDHLVAVTEASVRAAVAADIRVEMRRHDRAQVGFSAVGDAYADAARIAEGKQP